MDKLYTVVVTGSNKGIGKAAATELARKGYRIILACRNMVEAEKTKVELVELTKNQNITAMHLDLASAKSINQFVEQYTNEIGYINALVNNAGISTSKNALTEDGYEINIGTNYIGTYYLTTRMLPLFKNDEDNRIVNMTSNIHHIGWFDIAKLNSYRWFRAYAVSKYMILLYTKWLSESKNGHGIKVNAVHPGIVRTLIMYTGKWYDIIIKLLLRPYFIDVSEGAKPIISLVSDKDIGNGCYYPKGKKKEIRMNKTRKRQLDQLMKFSLGVCNDFANK
jgi:NAD(P)-dependent dehydrogenase (short-subunit alcohol dehydrogenase family)